MITTENILAKISSYDILDYYLKPYHNHSDLKAGQNISNPFIGEKQNTPSFNIFKNNNNEWRFKDFATGDKGSCFDFVMKIYNLSFVESLKRINNDFFLGLDEDKILDRKTDYKISKKPFTEDELHFWKSYGITKEILQKYNVYSLEYFESTSQQGNPYKINSDANNFIFCYDHNKWCKLYKPLGDKKYKFQHLGDKENDFIFGFNQLPASGGLVIITGGEKDVLSLASKGFYAISLNSETASITKNKVLELKARFKKVLVLYDIDDTGIKQSKFLATANGFHNLELPVIHNSGKDISDYFANGQSLEDLHSLINQAIKDPMPVELNTEKSVYNAVELLARGAVEQQYLMQPIFPQKGSAVLAGKPDTGKSQFARQLCIHVALGDNSFINFALNLKHNKSIYVATEDNEEATRFLLNKQFNGIGKPVVENLRFIFADTMSQEEIIKNLIEQLTLEPADLVVIDSFGDIFQGSDSNNNMAMRNTVKTFDKIGKEFNCLILFVHHINKAAYRVAPGQEHIQGGAGLVQKVRLAIVLSEGGGNTRYFTVVKGNYCPKEYKENSLELHFSEETFLFTNTGNLIPTDQLGSSPLSNDKEEKYDDLVEIATTIFGDKLLSYGNFTKQYCELTKKSIPTAKRAHANLKKLEIIIESNGAYRLNSLNTDSITINEDEELAF